MNGTYEDVYDVRGTDLVPFSQLLSMGAQAMSLNVTYNGGFCRHTYANLQNKARWEQFGKVHILIQPVHRGSASES